MDFGELARFCLRVLMPGGVLAMVLDGAVNDGRQSVTHMETVVGAERVPKYHAIGISRLAQRSIFEVSA